MHKAKNRDKRQKKMLIPIILQIFIKEDNMKVIKIYTPSQLVLLRNINPLLGRLRIPREIIKCMEYILKNEELGEHGFLLLLLYSLKDDIREIEDTVNAYPLKLDFAEEMQREEIRDNQCELSRNRVCL